MWRRSRAAWRPAWVRATLPTWVPASRIACPAASPPILAVRPTREVGILSFATEPMLAVARRLPGSAAPLHLGSGNDVVRAVGPADPRLVSAVVVACEQDQCGRLSHRRAGLRPLGIEAPPNPHERVVLELGAHRGRLGMAGMDAGPSRQLEQLVHDRGPQVGVGGV